MELLSNDCISASVCSHGAELCSVKCGETEYLWQADPAFWKRHSPVLFPIVGSLWNGVFRAEGKEFPMSQHGFARDMNFELVEKTEDYVKYRLQSSEATLERYPYYFELEISYRVEGHSVEVGWSVTNKGKGLMYFQIGAHPAFNYPDFKADDSVKGYFSLYSNGVRLNEFDYIIIKDKGCADPFNVMTYKMQDGLLPLDTNTFLKDAFILEDFQIDEVCLHGPDKKPYLSMTFDAPLCGLWSPPGKNAPFVCIEPWFGRCDRYGFEGEFKDRDHVLSLAPEENFNCSYKIVIPQE